MLLKCGCQHIFYSEISPITLPSNNIPKFMHLELYNRTSTKQCDENMKQTTKNVSKKKQAIFLRCCEDDNYATSYFLYK